MIFCYSLVEIGLKNGYNLDLFPIFRERDERKLIIFMLSVKSDKPRQDSYYLAAASRRVKSFSSR